MLQPGTIVLVKGEFGDWCVFEQYASGAVRIRSRNRRHPRFLTVSRLRLSPSKHLHRLTFLHDPSPVIRSSPDPPRNLLLWDTRFDPPIAPYVSPFEEWAIMRGNEDKLDWLQTNTLRTSLVMLARGSLEPWLLTARHFSERLPLLKAASQCTILGNALRILGLMAVTVYPVPILRIKVGRPKMVLD